MSSLWREERGDRWSNGIGGDGEKGMRIGGIVKETINACWMVYTPQLARYLRGFEFSSDFFFFFLLSFGSVEMLTWYSLGFRKQ